MADRSGSTTTPAEQRLAPGELRAGQPSSAWARTFAALRHPNYRLWFIGQLVSMAASSAPPGPIATSHSCGSAAILIMEKGRRMARDLLCADAGRSIQTYHSVPVFAWYRGRRQAKRWLEKVDLDDHGLRVLLFDPPHGHESPQATKQKPK